MHVLFIYCSMNSKSQKQRNQHLEPPFNHNEAEQQLISKNMRTSFNQVQLPSVPPNKHAKTDRPEAQNKSTTAPQLYHIVQQAKHQQHSHQHHASSLDHPYSQPFSISTMSKFCESTLDNDFAYLIHHNKKLCQELTFLINNWDILHLQFSAEAYRFVETFRFKIQTMTLCYHVYGQAIQLVRQLQKKLEYVEQNKSYDTRRTDILLKHYTNAELSKHDRLGVYLIVEQRDGENRSTLLQEYVKDTAQFYDNPFWADIFFMTEWWVDNRLNFGQCVQQIPNRVSERRVESHQIEPMNIGNLYELTFLYEGSNIYNAYNNEVKISSCGRIRDIWTGQGEKDFMWELTGLLNNEGGVIFWDCNEKYLKLEVVGSQLSEQNKLEIYLQISQLFNKIRPKITLGIDCLLQFVPIAYKPTSEQSWQGDRFKLTFKSGYYACMLKVINPDPTSIYEYVQFGRVTKCFKEISGWKADSILEEDGDEKEDYMEMQQNRIKAKQQLRLKLTPFKEQTQADRQKLVKFVKNYVQSQQNQSKVPQLANVSKAIGENAAAWQRKQIKVLSDSYQSLKIAQAEQYNPEGQQFYFMNLDTISLKSFLYKQSLPKYAEKYREIHSKKMKQAFIAELYQRREEPQSKKVSFTELENQNSISGFIYQKMPIAESIQHQLVIDIQTIHAEILQVEQSLRWQLNHKAQQPTDQHFKQEMSDCQALCKVLHFLRDRLHNCMVEFNHLNIEYFKKSIEKHKQIGNHHYALNRKRVEIYQQTNSIKANCKDIMGLNADHLQTNQFLNKIAAIYSKLVIHYHQCYRYTLDQLETIALLKLQLAHIISVQSEVQSEKCACFNRREITDKCFRQKHVDALLRLVRIAKERQQYLVRKQQSFNKNLWGNELNQKTQQFRQYITAYHAEPSISQNGGVIKPCLPRSKNASLLKKQKNFEGVFKSCYSIMQHIKDMSAISCQKVIGITPLLQQFTPKFEIYKDQVGLLEEFMSNVRHIWSEYFCLQPIIRQTRSALLGSPMKSLKKAKIITNPERDFPYASLLIAKPIHLPKIKQNLMKYGYYCEIEVFADKYRHVTDVCSVLFHFELHSDIIPLIRTKPDFFIDGMQLKAGAITEYVKLVKRKTVMSRQQFDNIVYWLRFEFPQEILKLIELVNEQDASEVEYYMKTQSKKSTALLFTVLGKLSQRDCSVLGKQSNECAFKNPVLVEGTYLKLIYSSDRR